MHSSTTSRILMGVVADARGIPAAFGQAAMLSRNMDYIAPVRRQVDNIFAAARTENGRLLIPHYYGESGGKVGWYGYREGEFFRRARLGIFRKRRSSCTSGRSILPI